MAEGQSIRISGSESQVSTFVSALFQLSRDPLSDMV